MTTLDFFDRVRNRLNDVVDPYLWSDEELLYFFNSGVNHIMSSIPQLGFPATDNIVLSPTVNTYVLPTNASSVVKITNKDFKDIQIVSWENLSKIPDTQKDSENLIISPNFLNKTVFIFNNVTDNIVANNSPLIITYIVKDFEITLEDLYSNTKTIPDELCQALLYFICKEAYLKDTVETFNANKHSMYRALFLEEFNRIKIHYLKKTPFSKEASISLRGLL